MGFNIGPAPYSTKDIFSSFRGSSGLYGHQYVSDVNIPSAVGVADFLDGNCGYGGGCDCDDGNWFEKYILNPWGAGLANSIYNRPMLPLAILGSIFAGSGQTAAAPTKTPPPPKKDPEITALFDAYKTVANDSY